MAFKYELKRPYRRLAAVRALTNAYVEGGWVSGSERLEVAGLS